MADYKRMVSYMYQYENGVKKKNVGYARIEAKNGQLKITLHMQLLGQLDSIFPTYLIQRTANDMELIYLGDSVLKNQVIDSKHLADENNIMDTGLKLSDMGGMLIFFNENIFFASDWDDKPIMANEVLEALKPKNQRSRENPSEKHPETGETGDGKVGEEKAASEIVFKDKEVVVDQGAGSEVLEADTQAAGVIADRKIERTERTERTDKLDMHASVPKYKLPRGWKMIERLQYPQSFINPVLLETTENPKPNIVQAKVFNVDGNDSTEILPDQDLWDMLRQEEDMEGDSDEALKENVMQGSKERTAEEEQPEHPTAQKLYDRYPRVYPFEDNEIILCVKIEPKDLGLLPKEYWPLSNNSFLMHGYYCYHHLIFAKIKDRYGCRYILGVPGIYHSRESFMAKMFGFECFKSIRKKELRQGDFGYWYKQVIF